jgi:hypothetical protein
MWFLLDWPLYANLCHRVFRRIGAKNVVATRVNLTRSSPNAADPHDNSAGRPLANPPRSIRQGTVR